VAATTAALKRSFRESVMKSTPMQQTAGLIALVLLFMNPADEVRQAN